MVSEYYNPSEFEGVAKDYFTSETAVTFGGVFSGVALGELIGGVIAGRMSGVEGLGAKLGAKTLGGLGVRYLTRGKKTWDGVGISLAAGLGGSAISDVVAYVTKTKIGYDFFINAIGGRLEIPGLPAGKPQPNTEEKKSKIFLKLVPVEEFENEPLEQASSVI